MDMNDIDREREFVHKSKSILDEAETTLDTNVLSQLEEGRHRALYGKERKDSRKWHRFRVPMLGVATAAVVVISAMLYLHGPNGTNHLYDIADIEILASSETIDFYNELDFCTWLTQEREHAG